MWDTATGKAVVHIRGADPADRNRMFATAALSPDGKLAAGVIYDAFKSGSQVLHVWDAVTGRELHRSEAPKAGSGLTFAPDGKRLAVRIGGEVVLVEAASGARTQLPGAAGDGGPLVFSPDGKRLATAGSDGRVRTWNVERREAGPDGPVAGRNCTAAGLSPEWDLAAFAGGDRFVRVLSAADGKERAAFGKLQQAAGAAEFSPDGALLAVGDAHLHLYDVAAGREVLRLESLVGYPSGLRFSPDGRSLAVSTTATETYVFDLAPVDPPARFDPAGFDETYAALAGDDASAAYRAVWSLAAGGDAAVARIRAAAAAPVPAGADAGLRRRRVVRALEMIAGAEAAALLESLADAEPAARAAVQRLRRRPAGP